MGRFPPVCVDCERREVGCHGTCAVCLSAKAEWDVRQETIRQTKIGQGDIIQLKKEGVAKMRKRYRSKKTGGGEQ